VSDEANDRIVAGGKITALKVQKRNTQRINIYLDGEFAFGLSRITAAWLRVGQELSAEKVTSLLAEDAHEVAYQQAVHFLDYRPRSSVEVRRNLEKHGIPEDVIDSVIQRLEGSSLLNDARFAELWVENRSDFRPRSRRALTVELRQRGVDRQVIEQALEDLDEEALAYQAALKQVRKLHNLEALEFRRKLAGFLARRGFGYEVIKPVVDKIWNEEQDTYREQEESD
jgi:regulatory protein